MRRLLGIVLVLWFMGAFIVAHFFTIMEDLKRNDDDPE